MTKAELEALETTANYLRQQIKTASSDDEWFRMCSAHRLITDLLVAKGRKPEVVS